MVYGIFLEKLEIFLEKELAKSFISNTIWQKNQILVLFQQNCIIFWPGIVGIEENYIRVFFKYTPKKFEGIVDHPDVIFLYIPTIKIISQKNSFRIGQVCWKCSTIWRWDTGSHAPLLASCFLPIKSTFFLLVVGWLEVSCVWCDWCVL